MLWCIDGICVPCHCRNRRPYNDPTKVMNLCLNWCCCFLVSSLCNLIYLAFQSRHNLMPQQEQGFNRTTQGGDNWEKVNQIRDKFEYDRERRMREKGESASLTISFYSMIFLYEWMLKSLRVVWSLRWGITVTRFKPGVLYPILLNMSLTYFLECIRSWDSCLIFSVFIYWRG